MATFPALVPSEAPIAPGAWPVTATISLNGAESRIRHGSAQIGRRLRLAFANVSEADFLAILSHYRGQRSGFDPFGFSTSTLASDLTPAGHAWLYASPPQVTDEHADVFGVVCEFKSEPRGLVAAPGKSWRSLTTLNPGARNGGVAYGPSIAWVTSSTTFAMVNPLTWATGVSDITYSDSNATITATATGEKTVRNYAAKSAGKWYVEMSAALLTGGGINSVQDTWWGVGTSNSNYPGQAGSGGIGITGSRIISQDCSASKSYSTLGYSSGSARILMIAVDFDAKKLWFGSDGTWLASGDPANGANPSAYSWSGTPSWYVCFRPYFSTDAATLLVSPSYKPSGFSQWTDS